MKTVKEYLNEMIDPKIYSDMNKADMTLSDKLLKKRFKGVKKLYQGLEMIKIYHMDLKKEKADPAAIKGVAKIINVLEINISQMS